jgi:hypothetical protein
MVRPESWIEPAGVSPARVSVGAPGSRPRSEAERLWARRGVKSLFGGSKRTGRSFMRILQPRQIHNPRAEPLTSRRRPCLVSRHSGAAARQVSAGYGERHVRTVRIRNRRDPSCQPSSGTDRSYKPTVKSSGGKRESEGVVVLVIAAQDNAAGGKDPCFGHAGSEGTR